MSKTFIAGFVYAWISNPLINFRAWRYRRDLARLLAARKGH